MSDWNSPDLTLRQGDTDAIDFDVVQADGETPQNVTGWDFVSTGKRSLYDADADALWQKTLAAGITARNAVLGQMTITLLPADTAGLTGSFFIDWRGRDPADQIHTGDVRRVRIAAVASRTVP